MYDRENQFMSKEQHECELTPEPDILIKDINFGYCVKFRRFVYSQIMFNPKNVRSRMLFKSAYVLRTERAHFLKNYRYMIHPFSNFRLGWQVFMVMVITCSLLISPWVLPLQLTPIIDIIELIIDSICFCDIVLSFHTGYIKKKERRVIMKRRLVALNYLTTYFPLDAIACLPLRIILSLERTPRNIKWYNFVVVHLRMFRCLTMWKYMNDLQMAYDLNQYKCKVLKVTLFVFLIHVWFVCTEAAILTNDRIHWLDGELSGLNYFLLSILKVLYQTLLFGSTRRTMHINEMTKESVFMCCGFIIHNIMISIMIQLISNRTAWSSLYQLKQQVQDFISYRRLPISISSRINHYLDFKYQNVYYNEFVVLNMLSSNINTEIVMHRCMHLLEKVNMFNDLPPQFLSKIVEVMTLEIFLPSDVIVTAGTVGDCMYFIYSGTVAAYLRTGKEICHISDGAVFGELSLIIRNELRMATVTAIDSCELYRLTQKDFMSLFERFPDLFLRVQKVCQDRFRRNFLFYEDEEPQADITEVETPNTFLNI